MSVRGRVKVKCGSISREEGRGIIKGGRERERVGGKEEGREENDSPLFFSCFKRLTCLLVSEIDFASSM